MRKVPRAHGARFADVVVVGGGIAGLAAAHRLGELAREAGLAPDVRLLEGGSRLGGPVRTDRVDGVVLEAGPDQFVTFKPAALALCRRLGLEDELLMLDPGRTPMQVVHRGRPVPVPAGLRVVAPTQLGPLLRSPLFSWMGKARMAAELFVPPRTARGDESVASFIERRFGRELHERAVEPLIGGIFTADTTKLSAELALPRVLELEQTHGSITRAMRAAAARGSGGGAAFAALRGGMERLVERLTQRLDATVELGARVEELRPHGNGAGWRLRLADGEDRYAGTVVLALPGHAGAPLVREIDRDLARRFGAIDYAPCATISLLYPRAAVGRQLAGFGFFVPAVAGLEILACSYVNLKFPERAPVDRLLFRVFVGGGRRRELLELDDEGLARLAHRSLDGLLELSALPELTRVYRFPRAMLQFAVGFRQEADAIERAVRRQPGLFLCGTATGAFGLPDCIASGERAAGAAFAHLAGQRPSQSSAAQRVV